MRLGLLVVVVVLLQGCSNDMPSDTGGGGGGGTGGGGQGKLDGGPPVPLEAYCSRHDLARCELDQRCGATAPNIDCRKMTQLSRTDLHSAATRLDCLWALRDGLDAGRIVYHGDQAATCFAATATLAACNQNLIFRTADCAGIFTGTAGTGAPCELGEECTPGHYCEADNACPGSCRAQVAAGAMATNPLSCPPGTFFALRTDGTIYCYSPLQPGRPCLDAASDHMVCSGENACIPTSDGGATCQPLETDGQMTAPGSLFDNPCAFGTTLVVTSPDGPGQCVALSRSGEACYSTSPQCQLGLACTAAQTCGALLEADAGCTADGDCVFGEGCIYGSCTPWVAVDGGCATGADDDCDLGLFCNDSGHCEARRALGASCENSGQCVLDQGLDCLSDDAGQPRCQVLSRCNPIE